MAATTPPKNASIGVTFLSTGTVRIRPSMRSQPLTTTNVLTRRLRSLCGRGWTDPLPIGVFLITHPDGPILFDTGESPHHNDPGFVPFYSPSTLLSSTAIGPEDGILSQLRARGVDPASLQAIVLSHLHGDHAGGLADLAAAAPNVPVYVSKAHWDAVTSLSSFSAKIAGFGPQHWPKDFRPRFLSHSDPAVGPWPVSSHITPDGRIVAVDTPGHVPGHVSLVVFGDGPEGQEGGGEGTTYLLAGGATYGVGLLDKEERGGVNEDPVGAVESLKLIKAFAREREVVVLPSHDPGVGGLLEGRVVYRPKE